MHDHYYDPEDLKNFGKVTEFEEKMGAKFFEYYQTVFGKGALSAREKSLIALAVAHVVQCPYCIDAYSTDCLEKGANEQQMMEAVRCCCAPHIQHTSIPCPYPSAVKIPVFVSVGF